jgi:hypothetical protein
MACTLLFVVHVKNRFGIIFFPYELVITTVYRNQLEVFNKNVNKRGVGWAGILSDMRRGECPAYQISCFVRHHPQLCMAPLSNLSSNTYVLFFFPTQTRYGTYPLCIMRKLYLIDTFTLCTGTYLLSTKDSAQKIVPN